MKRYTYNVSSITLHGIKCLIGRLYRDGVLVHETTGTLEDVKASCYRHFVRLAELDEIEAA